MFCVPNDRISIFVLFSLQLHNNKYQHYSSSNWHDAVIYFLLFVWPFRTHLSLTSLLSPPQVMANLNFQQPPRIPSASLSRSTNSGFGNSISGNVTPTSLMFQSSQQSVSNSSYVTTPGQQQQNPQNQQQLSPNRGGNQMAIGVNIVTPSMANRRMYNPSIQPRDDFNTRRMAPSGLGGSMNMGTFMQTGRYGSQSGGINNFQSVFGSSDTPPTLLDMSEFPSLTNARQNDQHSNVLQAPGSKPYGMSIVSISADLMTMLTLSFLVYSWNGKTTNIGTNRISNVKRGLPSSSWYER